MKALKSQVRRFVNSKENQELAKKVMLVLLLLVVARSQTAYLQSIKNFFRSISSHFYLDYALVWPWLVKTYTLLRVKSVSQIYNNYKTTIYKDVKKTAIFLCELYALNIAIEQGYLSKDVLVAIFQTGIIQSERSIKEIGPKSTQHLCKGIIGYNLYSLVANGALEQDLSLLATSSFLGFGSVYALQKHFT